MDIVISHVFCPHALSGIVECASAGESMGLALPLRVDGPFNHSPGSLIEGTPWGPIPTRLTWTGRGASFALAEVISATLSAVGVPARCIPPEEARGPIAWVSRSGSAEVAADVLLTEAPGVGHRVVVRADEPADAWFPARWQQAVLASLADRLGETLPELPPPAPGVVVVPAGARAIATLLDAVDAKLGLRPWRVTTSGDFGHGALARVASEGAHVSVLGGDAAIEAWVRDRVGGRAARVDIPPTGLPSALLAYAWVLGGVAELARRAERPFPEHLDTLRRAR